MPHYSVSIRRQPLSDEGMICQALAVWYDRGGHQERVLGDIVVDIAKGPAGATLKAALLALAEALD